jgi:hypothetical protein
MVINFVNSDLFPIFFEADRILKSRNSRHLELSKLEDGTNKKYDLDPPLTKPLHSIV